MSRELAVQFARENIRVNALCPGPVNTPLLIELFAKDPERAARRLVHVPMGASASPKRSPTRCCFSPVTTPRSSPRRRSWSTAVFTAPTSRRCSPGRQRRRIRLLRFARAPPLAHDDLNRRRDGHGEQDRDESAGQSRDPGAQVGTDQTATNTSNGLIFTVRLMTIGFKT